MRVHHRSLRGGRFDRRSEGFGAFEESGIAGMGRSGQVPQALDEIHTFCICFQAAITGLWLRARLVGA